MRSGQPYRPASNETREKMRDAQLARLGIEPDQRIVYGQVFPVDLANALRPHLAEIARTVSPEEARGASARVRRALFRPAPVRS